MYEEEHACDGRIYVCDTCVARPFVTNHLTSDALRGTSSLGPPERAVMLALVVPMMTACPQTCGECPPPGYAGACCVNGTTCQLLSPSQCAAASALSSYCPTSAPLPPGVCPSWTLEHAGYCYAVMDRHPYFSAWETNLSKCQSTFLTLPLGWEAVPACTVALATVLSSRNGSRPGPQSFGASYSWDTDYLVYANGDYSASYVNGSDPPPYWGLGQCHNASGGCLPGGDCPPKLEQNGRSYKVGDCTVYGKKVLMRKPIG